MPVLINFKICDNAEECFGIENCPSGALSWDKKNKTIKIDNSKCTSCGTCEKACEVYAIRVAKNDREYLEIEKEFEEDPRRISDLCVDRYGAQPIHPAFMISEDEFKQHILEAGVTVAVEFFQNSGIECMLKSIPIKTLLQNRSVKYRKMEVKSNKLPDLYKIKKFPALLFFNHGKLLGKIEGYYSEDQFELVRNKTNKILN